MKIQIFLLSAVSCLLLGCLNRYRSQVPFIQPSPFKPKNVYIASKNNSKIISRVAVLPLAANNNLGISKDTYLHLYKNFFHELLNRKIFECVNVEEEFLMEFFHKDRFLSSEELPKNFLLTLQEQKNVDGVLFVDITAYRPYKPVSIGVRCKLFSVDGECVWAIDEIFNSGNQKTFIGAKNFSEDFQESNVNLVYDESMYYSPIRFSSYVAKEIFVTLEKYFR